MLKTLGRLIDRSIRDGFRLSRPLHDNKPVYRTSRSRNFHQLFTKVDRAVSTGELVMGVILDERDRSTKNRSNI